MNNLCFVIVPAPAEKLGVQLHRLREEPAAGREAAACRRELWRDSVLRGALGGGDLLLHGGWLRRAG